MESREAETPAGRAEPSGVPRWQEPGQEESHPYVRRLPVRRSGGVILYLAVEQLDWVEAADQYVRLHAGKERYLVRESMRCLESWLDPKRFLRIHRSVIVNLMRVRELRSESPKERWAVLVNGKSLQVSQGRWKALQDALMMCP